MKNKTKKQVAAIISAIAILISGSSFPAYANNLDGLENCHQLDKYEVDDSEWFTSATKNGRSTISVTDPQYTSNTYFTVNSQECTDHGTVNGVYIGNPCSANGACNCKVFEYSIQCAGFARHIYKRYHGTSINNVSKNNLNVSITSAAQAKALIKDLPIGTFIKVNAKTSSGGYVQHFMIVSNTSEDNVLLYHANYGGNCRVRNMRIPYDEFAANFTYIYYTC